MCPRTAQPGNDRCPRRRLRAPGARACAPPAGTEETDNFTTGCAVWRGAGEQAMPAYDCDNANSPFDGGTGTRVTHAFRGHAPRHVSKSAGIEPAFTRSKDRTSSPPASSSSGGIGENGFDLAVLVHQAKNPISSPPGIRISRASFPPGNSRACTGLSGSAALPLSYWNASLRPRKESNLRPAV